MAVDRRWEPGAGNLHAGLCPGGGPKGPSLPGLEVYVEVGDPALSLVKGGAQVQVDVAVKVHAYDQVNANANVGNLPDGETGR
jgi:hypothetical protein